MVTISAALQLEAACPPVLLFSALITRLVIHQPTKFQHKLQNFLPDFRSRPFIIYIYHSFGRRPNMTFTSISRPSLPQFYRWSES